MSESEEVQVPRCDGSYKLGTACGACPRCAERNYGPAEKQAAVEAERERTKDLPANRVKPKQ
jgi:hypothetical protein